MHNLPYEILKFEVDKPRRTKCSKNRRRHVFKRHRQDHFLKDSKFHNLKRGDELSKNHFVEKLLSIIMAGNFFAHLSPMARTF